MPDLDLSQSIIPKSDQINYEDLASGATATYTIRSVTAGNSEQPFNFMLVETDKAYRPSKTMRKVIVAAWGSKTGAYVGRRLTLYGEPSILFGGKKVGGLRISAMSDISGQLEVMAQTTRGKRETFTVQPLASSSPSTGGMPDNSRGSFPESGGSLVDSGPAGNRSEAEQASQSETAAPAESLRQAINREIRAIQADGGAAWLRTWADSVGVAASSAAIAEKFGEDARELRKLMAELPTDVPDA